MALLRSAGVLQRLVLTFKGYILGVECRTRAIGRLPPMFGKRVSDPVHRRLASKTHPTATGAT